MRVAALIAAACAACDPAYSLHLHARITEHGRPRAGAWVMGLNGDSLLRPGAVRTGADGIAELELKAFLRNPAQEPVAVAVGADALVVAFPERDFAPRKKGLFFAREWDATLEMAMAPQPPEISLRCAGRSCAVQSPGLDCSWYELSIAESHAEGHLIYVAPRTPAGQTISFASKGGPPLAVVAVCFDGKEWRALVSNAVAGVLERP
jgi:hypothetical protein